MPKLELDDGLLCFLSLDHASVGVDEQKALPIL